MFPVCLSIEGRRCLVVGGGGVALRKVRSLVSESARVTVVAPSVVAGLEEMADDGQIALERRAYREGEARGYALVLATTDSQQVNRRVSEDAEGAGVWVNVADDPKACSFHLPARVRRGPLELAIASGGRAPFVVRRLRETLEGRLDAGWAAWAETAARFRSEVHRLAIPAAEKEAIFDRFFAETVDRERLTTRTPTPKEWRSWIDGRGGAPRVPPASAAEVGDRGFVSLVGAGPGNGGLLTVRGRERLLAADAVLYDRLAGPALPCDLPSRIELHCVGKNAGNHPVPQDEINALMLRLAREGKRVVRLKGGDPYVFGRGGEEAEVLAAAAIPFEVIPGVSAGIAVASWIGVPVTHRREAVRVTFVTAHETTKPDGSQVRWDLLAADPHATLVGYMGLAGLPGAVAQLLSAGMSPDTPAAMVQHGTTAAQRAVVSTLAALPRDVEQAGLGPPALFIIGPTVDHAKRLDWAQRLPLAGERLLVASAAGGLAGPLESAGAEVISVSLPVTPAARVVIGALPLTGCVVGTPEEVGALDRETGSAGWRAGVAAWCLTRDTARRARELGWERVEEVEANAGGSSLLQRIGRLRDSNPRPSREGGGSC
jgi:uroporphyrin-III C-methyltransferase/precorrin-2 dehydrogenase/sirohydrochlorin ferrochelatase